MMNESKRRLTLMSLSIGLSFAICGTIAFPVDAEEENGLLVDGLLSSAPMDLAVHCNGTSSPLDFGPQCCPGRAALHPHPNPSSYKTRHPRLDATGYYRGSADRANALAVDNGTLQVCAVYVIDNGEGSGWPHGPYGNLYWDVFKPSEPLQASPNGAHKRRIQAPRVLRGPHNTHGKTDEWLDDEVVKYKGFGLYNWGDHPTTKQRLIIRVWESDSMSEDGNWLGRRNDVMGMELITRSRTEAAEVWVPFHKYTNGHPRRRMNAVALWMLLRTGGTCNGKQKRKVVVIAPYE